MESGKSQLFILSGELDNATADGVFDGIDAALAGRRQDAPRVFLDMAGVGYVASRAVHRLVQLEDGLRRRHGTLRIHRLRPFPRRILEVARADTVLDAAVAADTSSN